jgi:hypothetical protein
LAQSCDQSQSFKAEILKFVDKDVPVGREPSIFDDHPRLMDRSLEGQQALLPK